MRRKIICTFHHNIENIYDEQLLKDILFVSVNDALPKKNNIPHEIEIVKESNLTGYFDYQSLKYNESSVIINMANNVEDVDVISFVQYDMSIKIGYMEDVERAKDNYVQHWNTGYLTGSECLSGIFNPYFTRIVEKYNEMYNDNNNLDEIRGPLYSTFSLKKSDYLEMIRFYKECETIIFDYINQYGKRDRYIDGLMERFWCLYLGMKFKDNVNVTENIQHLCYTVKDRVYNNH